MIRTGRCGVGSEQGGIERRRRAGGARAVAERVRSVAHRPGGRRCACRRARRPVCSLPRVHLTLARHERREKIAAAGRARAAAALVAAGARECMARARAHLESLSCSSRPVVILCARTTRAGDSPVRAPQGRNLASDVSARWEAAGGFDLANNPPVSRSRTHRSRLPARSAAALGGADPATRAARSAKCRRLT